MFKVFFLLKTNKRKHKQTKRGKFKTILTMQLTKKVTVTRKTSFDVANLDLIKENILYFNISLLPQTTNQSAIFFGVFGISENQKRIVKLWGTFSLLTSRDQDDERQQHGRHHPANPVPRHVAAEGEGILGNRQKPPHI